MKCPNCNHAGNLLKRPFVRRKGLPDTYCVKCGAHIKIRYNYSKIALLALGIVLALVILHLILEASGFPGVNSGMAGGISGGFLVIFMQRKPFVNIEQVLYEDNNKKKKKQ